LPWFARLATKIQCKCLTAVILAKTGVAVYRYLDNPVVTCPREFKGKFFPIIPRGYWKYKSH